MAWLLGWKRRKPFTIAATYRDLGDLTDFPFYLPIVDDPDIAAHAKADGSDLRFTLADGTTLLYHHRGLYQVSDGVAEGRFWVREPSLPMGQAVTGFCYYDNPEASDTSSGLDTWANHAAVWHLEESGSGTPGEFKDARGLRHGTAGTGAFSPTRQAGKTGYGQLCDGSNDYISVSHHETLNCYPLTVTAWVRTTATDGYDRPIARKMSGSLGYMISTRLGSLRGYYRHNGNYVLNQMSGQSVSDGAWHLAKFVLNSSGGRFYIDGQEKQLQPWAGTPGPTSPTAELTLSYSYGAWSGDLDEIRIANVAHTAAWAKFEYHNESDADNCLSWGEEEFLVPGPYRVATAGVFLTGAAIGQVAIPGSLTGRVAIPGAAVGQVCV